MDHMQGNVPRTGDVFASATGERRTIIDVRKAAYSFVIVYSSSYHSMIDEKEISLPSWNRWMKSNDATLIEGNNDNTA